MRIPKRLRGRSAKPSFVGSNPTPHSIQIESLNVVEIYVFYYLFYRLFCHFVVDDAQNEVFAHRNAGRLNRWLQVIDSGLSLSEIPTNCSRWQSVKLTFTSANSALRLPLKCKSRTFEEIVILLVTAKPMGSLEVCCP